MTKIDLLIFGATGFTGQYVVETLAKTIHKYRLPITWAVASRNAQGSKQCLQNVSALTGNKLNDIPVFEANVNDLNSMNTAFKKCTLVLNCIGPYSLLGEPVMQSCIESGSYYMDLSGEPLFMEQMQIKFDKIAKQKKISLVGSCGFDSIPADLGASLLKNNFDGKLNQIEHYLQIWNKSKRFNYATWAALVEGYKNRDQLKKVREMIYSEYKRYDWPVTLKRKSFQKNKFAYCVPFPGSDRSVVSRSQMYRFSQLGEIPTQFEAYFCIPDLFTLFKLFLTNYNLQILTKSDFGNKILLEYSRFFSMGIFDKNERPLRKNLEENKFRITLIGKGWPKEVTEQNRDNMTKCSAVTIDGGDLAYIDTSVITVQTALILLDKIRQNTLPYGVLTPNSAIEEKELVPKLNQEGIQFKFIPDYKNV